MGKISYFALGVLFCLMGCGKDQSPTASPFVKDSFGAEAIQNQNDLSGNKFNLVLKKSALEKEFLLNASLIPQDEDGMNTSHGLQSRIIVFMRRADKVYLLEATQGHRISSDIPENLVRAEIPVLKDQGDSLILDFNAGMRQIFMSSGFYGSDSSGFNVKADNEAIPIRSSYIQSIDFQNQTIEISQMVQADLSTVQQLPNFEIRYYLSPYISNPNFKSKENVNKTAHFFEIAPQYREDGSGLSDTFVITRDPKKSVTYYISANTPSEYVQTIKEGVQYWNQVLGKDYLKAEMAPAGITAPNPQYDIIQWVPDDGAGSAYADALTDPRTGEILHSQIYLTSAFTNGLKLQLPSLQRKLKYRDGRKQISVQLSNLLFPAQLCDFTEDISAISDLASAKLAGVTEDQLQGLIKDYLRHTVAHEVGHTLGLRHNFAGSLGSEVSVVDKNKAFIDYALRGTLPNSKVYSSSIMDYLSFTERVLTGYQQLSQILPYDRMMMEWGYNDKPMPLQTPLFCTDTQLGKYLDCLITDSGKDPLVSAHTDMMTGMSSIPVLFAESFIHAKVAIDPRDRIRFDKVNVNPDSILEMPGMFFTHLATWLNPATPSLTVTQMFPFIGPLDIDAVKAKDTDWVQRQVTEVGGVDKLFFNLLPATDHPGYDFSTIGNKFLGEYINRPYIQSGIGEDGQPYSLSQDDINFIINQGTTFFPKIEESFLKAALGILGIMKYQDKITPLSMEVEKRLGLLAEEVILAQSDPGIFKYSSEIRIAAAKILDKKLGKVLDWNLDNTTRIVGELTEIVTKSLHKKISDIKLPALKRYPREWYMEQNEVLKALNSGQ